MSKYDPAFPGMEKVQIFSDERGKYVDRYFLLGGLTKLEWFAGMALMGMLANPKVLNDINTVTYKVIAADAFDIAKAVLDESETRQ